MAEVEPWFDDVFNAARQLLSQPTAMNQDARVDSRQIADQCGRSCRTIRPGFNRDACLVGVVSGPSRVRRPPDCRR